MPELQAGIGSIRLDEERLSWLTDHLDVAGKRVVGIGANLGYFTFRLADERHAQVVAFEPYEPHARAMTLIAELCGLSDNVEVRNQGVALAEVGSLPESDLVLFLNVLQHAGQDFDAELVRSPAEWEAYAVSYLQELRGRTQHLLYQQGYAWLGHAGPLCPDADMFDLTARVLTSAGWKIRSCGVIRDLGRPHYVDYPLSPDSLNPVALPEPSTSLLSRATRRLLRQPAHRISRYNPGFYRFAQRPLILCDAMN
jgi:hypothetical protein